MPVAIKLICDFVKKKYDDLFALKLFKAFLTDVNFVFFLFLKMILHRVADRVVLFSKIETCAKMLKNFYNDA